MKNELRLYRVNHISRDWLTDNWGKGKAVAGYVAHTSQYQCYVKSHKRYLQANLSSTCRGWKVLGVSCEEG